MKNKKWLGATEYLLLMGSGIGSIAAIASQQLAFTAAPMSLLLLLNVVNRRRLDQETLNAANTNIASVDHRLSNNIKALDQQVRTLPTFLDLASLRKMVQQRNDKAITQLQHNITQRLTPLENQNFQQVEQGLAELQSKYSQLAESLSVVTTYLNRLATVNRVEGAEATITQLRGEMTQLQAKLNEVAIAQKQSVPRALQDQIYQLNRRFNSLPQPFDATTLKQDVDGLVKVVGEMVSRRDLARLMAEVEKIRLQHQSLEQTVAPMKAANTIMRKQMSTLSSWVNTKDQPSEEISQPMKETELEALKGTISALEQRLDRLPKEGDLAEMRTVMNEHLSQLQQQFNSVQQVTQSLDQQQKDLVDWLNRLPKALDASALQNQIKYLTSRLELTETNLSDLQNQLKTLDRADASPSNPTPEYEFVFNLNPTRNQLDLLSNSQANSQALFEKALKTAQSRVVLVFPYPDRTTLDDCLIQQFQAFLNRGGLLDIGWGHLGNLPESQQACYIHAPQPRCTEKIFLKKVLNQLTQLKRSYPTQFRFKVLGTNENFLVCDNAYGILGVHPVATANITFPEVAVGLQTTNEAVIKGLLDRYENPVLGKDDATAYFNRAMTRDELGDKSGAIADYSEVIRIHPNHAVAYNNRALICCELGNKPGAIEDLNRAILSNPRNEIAYCNRGVIRLQLGDKAGAIKDFGDAIQVNPECSNAYLQRGLARVRLGNKTGAIEDFGAMIRVNPQDALGYFHRGLVRTQIGDQTNAIRDLKEAAWLFSAQGEQSKYQQAIDALNKLRKQPVGTKVVEKVVEKVAEASA